jgi:hypothetical protein
MRSTGPAVLVSFAASFLQLSLSLPCPPQEIVHSRSNSNRSSIPFEENDPAVLTEQKISRLLASHITMRVSCFEMQIHLSPSMRASHADEKSRGTLTVLECKDDGGDCLGKGKDPTHIRLAHRGPRLVEHKAQSYLS